MLVFHLINDILLREETLREHALTFAHFQKQRESYEQLCQNLEDQRRYAHEFKNHILCVDQMIKEKNYEALDSYISQIYKKTRSPHQTFYTNNKIVDTILNAKFNEMLQKSILFIFELDNLARVQMEDDDLVVLLSNLLNNAIEAAEKYHGKKVIKMKFVIDQDEVLLSVRNSTNTRIKPKNGIFQTSKKSQPELHGYGLRNIKCIVEKYDGYYSFTCEDEEFAFSTMFPAGPPL